MSPEPRRTPRLAPDHTAAITHVAAWMEKLKEERTKLTRITSWALDDNDGFGDH